MCLIKSRDHGKQNKARPNVKQRSKEIMKRPNKVKRSWNDKEVIRSWKDQLTKKSRDYGKTLKKKKKTSKKIKGSWKDKMRNLKEPKIEMSIAKQNHG